VIIFIDIGGTPAIVLRRSLDALLNANGINKEQVIAILDPFDLSRTERKLELGNYKINAIKFPVEVPNGLTDLSADEVAAPKKEECRMLFEKAKDVVLGKIQSNYGGRIDFSKVAERYTFAANTIPILAENSKTLREFMNEVLRFLAPGLNTLNLEDLLSKNREIVYEILQKTDIPARAICPNCKRFTEIWLRQEISLCTKCNKPVITDQIIRSGKYIPEKGFFGVITFLCGYKMFSNSTEKMSQAGKIMSDIGRMGSPLFNYKEQNEEITVFEYFLLGDQLK